MNGRNVAFVAVRNSAWTFSQRQAGRRKAYPNPPAVLPHVVLASSIVTLSPGRAIAAQSIAQASRPASSTSMTTEGSSTTDPLLPTSTVTLPTTRTGINVIIFCLVISEMLTSAQGKTAWK